jgi:hypothetical protein
MIFAALIIRLAFSPLRAHTYAKPAADTSLCFYYRFFINIHIKLFTDDKTFFWAGSTIMQFIPVKRALKVLHFD